MNEAEARSWIRTYYGVSRETLLAEYVALLIDEASRQNLVSPASLAEIWSRHIVDSAQLVPLAAGRSGLWLDIGTGAGLPGLVVAILRDDPMLLVEPRGKRADFLRFCTEKLSLPHVRVAATKVAIVTEFATVISARAVASIDQLFNHASQCADANTLWLLPRGQSGKAELAGARKTWQGAFHVEQSVTHHDSVIITATGVGRR